MPEIKALFWDVGRRAADQCLGPYAKGSGNPEVPAGRVEFTERHELVASSFERGKISLDEYLDRRFFIGCGRSREKNSRITCTRFRCRTKGAWFARALADSGKYLMGTINNESRELNAYRIEKFGLRGIFRVFVSSCFVGLRKPEEGIYRLGARYQRSRLRGVLFHRRSRVESRDREAMGMHTIEMDGAEQLRRDLKKLGVG